MIILNKEKCGTTPLASIGLILFLICGLTFVSFGQTEKPPMRSAHYTNYKGVKIGTPAKQVRNKLGKKPKIADKDGFYYVFSKDESAQIRLDKNNKVRYLAVTYSKNNPDAPGLVDVFGEDVPVKKFKDGRIYKLIRYPKAGFWVAYSTSVGKYPTVSITIQKM